MKIDFYYWGNMCPISAEILDLIHRYKSKVNINTYEISNDLSVSKNKKIFFPFLTVINDVNRYYAPINKKFMEQVVSGIIPVEKPYIPELGTESVAKTIKPITEKNYNIASQCTSRTNCLGCGSKIKMYNSMNEDVYGFISDEIGIFPNGNLDFFLKNNYKDEAIVFEDDYCKLHLMSKIL